MAKNIIDGLDVDTFLAEFGQNDDNPVVGRFRGRGIVAPVDTVLTLPKESRLFHTLVVAPTGKGRSVNYLMPNFARALGETDASHVFVDLKSPYMFGHLNGDQEKRVVFLDPFVDDVRALAIEPVWGAGADERRAMARVLQYYSQDRDKNGQVLEAERAQEERELLERLLWRMSLDRPDVCSIPIALGWIVDGKRNPSALGGYLSRTGRPVVGSEVVRPVLNGERAGSMVAMSGARIVKLIARRIHEELAHTTVSREKFYLELGQAYAELGEEHDRYEAAGAIKDVDALAQELGARIERNLGFLLEGPVAQALSRPEYDLDGLFERAEVLLVGCPLGKTGSSVYGSLVLSLLGVKGTARRHRQHSVFFHIDEPDYFTGWGGLDMLLAVGRSYRIGVTVYTQRIEPQWVANAQTILLSDGVRNLDQIVPDGVLRKLEKHSRSGWLVGRAGQWGMVEALPYWEDELSRTTFGLRLVEGANGMRYEGPGFTPKKRRAMVSEFDFLDGRSDPVRGQVQRDDFILEGRLRGFDSSLSLSRGWSQS